MMVEVETFPCKGGPLEWFPKKFEALRQALHFALPGLLESLEMISRSDR